MAYTQEIEVMAQEQSENSRQNEMQLDERIPRFILRGGILTSVSLIGYFLLASIFDFKEIVELRYLNVFILAIGVFTTEYMFHRNAHHRNTNYFNGVALGMGTGLFAGLIFSIFLYIFMKFLAPDFGLALQEAVPFSFVSVELLAIVAFLETLLPSFMATFIAMQYFKNVDEI